MGIKKMFTATKTGINQSIFTVYTLYMLRLSLEAKFYQVFRSYFKKILRFVFLKNVEKGWFSKLPGRIQYPCNIKKSVKL